MDLRSWEHYRIANDLDLRVERARAWVTIMAGLISGRPAFASVPEEAVKEVDDLMVEWEKRFGREAP